MRYTKGKMSIMGRTHKEAVYDEHIFPLMEQIIVLCKEHKINMVADFSLGYAPATDESLFCTTVLPKIDPEDKRGAERMMRAYNALKSEPQLFAYTITSRA